MRVAVKEIVAEQFPSDTNIGVMDEEVGINRWNEEIIKRYKGKELHYNDAGKLLWHGKPGEALRNMSQIDDIELVAQERGWGLTEVSDDVRDYIVKLGYPLGRDVIGTGGAASKGPLPAPGKPALWYAYPAPTTTIVYLPADRSLVTQLIQKGSGTVKSPRSKFHYDENGSVLWVGRNLTSTEQIVSARALRQIAKEKGWKVTRISWSVMKFIQEQGYEEGPLPSPGKVAIWNWDSIDTDILGEQMHYGIPFYQYHENTPRSYELIYLPQDRDLARELIQMAKET